MKKLILHSLTIVLAITNLYSQDLKKVGYTQLANDIFMSDKDTVHYQNVHFINDLPDKGAELFFTTYIEPGALWTIYGGFRNYLKTKGAKRDALGLFVSTCKSIEIKDCKFDNDLLFSKVHFHGNVSLEDNDFPVQSEDFVGLYGQKFGGAVLLDSCKFRGSFTLHVRKEFPYRFFFKFNHSEAKWFNLELQESTTQIKQSKLSGSYHIQIHKDSDVDFHDNTFGQGYFQLDNTNRINYYNNVVNDSTDEFSRFDWNAENINLSNNTFRSNIALQFEESKIDISENTFEKKLGLHFVSIAKSSYVNIKYLKDLNFGVFRYGEYYDASAPQQISDEREFKNYLRVHKALYDHFKEVGDIKSANATYVRIREIEHVQLSFLYEANPSFQNFFTLNLNRLLKAYTNYGTEPAKALIISVYIIFAFGIFYFFFPSDWDTTSKSKLIANFSDFIEKNDKGYLKPFLILTVAIFISAVNAATLSLNAFTTLGFGNIPTHGVARYVCVLQGFIGWFLLSIFTVALINQAQF